MLVRERPIKNARPIRGGYTLMEMLVVVAIIVVLAGIGGVYLFPKLTESKEDVDLTQVKMLTQQCQEYRIHNDSWPPNLDALTQPKPGGGAPYVEEAAIHTRLRPNEVYQYDASGPNNKGLKPDIWVVSDSGKQIGNWVGKLQH